MSKKLVKAISRFPGKTILGLLLIGLTMLSEKPATAGIKGTTDGKNFQPSSAALSVAESPANLEMLHERLRKKNPGYQNQARFTTDPVLGLIGDFSGDRVTDLSPLQGVPFGALDLRGQAVSNLKPLRGMPLKVLGLEETEVKDLNPLRGMKLEKLYLNNTAVLDLKPLAGMPLKELMLVGTKVQDLNPLRSMPLQTLWLNDTPVSDISPLAFSPLVSLTLHRTKVSDLGSLAKMTRLKRLHIGETAVCDVSPLKGLRLERLILTPANIKSGLPLVRHMKTIKEIGTTLENRMSPELFWELHDQGNLR